MTDLARPPKGQQRGEGREELPLPIQSGFPGQTFPNLDTSQPLWSKREVWGGTSTYVSLGFQRRAEHGGDTNLPRPAIKGSSLGLWLGRGGSGKGAWRRGSRLGSQPTLPGSPSAPIRIHLQRILSQDGSEFLSLLPLIPSGAVYG